MDEFPAHELKRESAKPNGQVHVFVDVHSAPPVHSDEQEAGQPSASEA